MPAIATPTLEFAYAAHGPGDGPARAAVLELAGA